MFVKRIEVRDALSAKKRASHGAMKPITDQKNQRLVEKAVVENSLPEIAFAKR